MASFKSYTSRGSRESTTNSVSDPGRVFDLETVFRRNPHLLPGIDDVLLVRHLRRWAPAASRFRRTAWPACTGNRSGSLRNSERSILPCGKSGPNPPARLWPSLRSTARRCSGNRDSLPHSATAARRLFRLLGRCGCRFLHSGGLDRRQRLLGITGREVIQLPRRTWGFCCAKTKPAVRTTIQPIDLRIARPP